MLILPMNSSTDIKYEVTLMQRYHKPKPKVYRKITSFSAMNFKSLYMHLLKVFLIRLMQNSLHDDHHRKKKFTVRFIIVNKRRFSEGVY